MIHWLVLSGVQITSSGNRLSSVQAETMQLLLSTADTAESHEAMVSALRDAAAAGILAEQADKGRVRAHRNGDGQPDVDDDGCSWDPSSAPSTQDLGWGPALDDVPQRLRDGWG